MTQPSRPRLFAVGSLTTILLALTGCASTGGLPGGGDSTNKDFFKSDRDMMERLNTVTVAAKSNPALPMSKVLTLLGRQRLELNTMNRTAIRGSLEGTGTSPVPLANSTLTEEKLACKEGLSFVFSDTNSRYAVNDPVRWQQNTKGFSYKVDMIFNKCGNTDPTLENVIIDGGPINTLRKKTLFDLFSAYKLLAQ